MVLRELCYLRLDSKFNKFTSDDPNVYFVICPTVSPTDPRIVYDWFDVGVLDYDAEKQLYLVQKVNRNDRVIDASGNAIVNGGLQPDGKTTSPYLVIKFIQNFEKKGLSKSLLNKWKRILILFKLI